VQIYSPFPLTHTHTPSTALPQFSATHVSFFDESPIAAEVSGTVEITRPIEETGLHTYSIYFSSNGATKDSTHNDSIASATVDEEQNSSSTVTYETVEDSIHHSTTRLIRVAISRVLVPEGMSHLVVLSSDVSGREMVVGPAALVADNGV